MYIVTDYKEYDEMKTAFAKKHNKKSECKVMTSPMENNSYHKEYCWEDGANWFEKTELITEVHEVTVHGIVNKVELQFWKAEYWNTEMAGSFLLYERA